MKKIAYVVFSKSDMEEPAKVCMEALDNICQSGDGLVWIKSEDVSTSSFEERKQAIMQFLQQGHDCIIITRGP